MNEVFISVHFTRPGKKPVRTESVLLVIALQGEEALAVYGVRFKAHHADVLTTKPVSHRKVLVKQSCGVILLRILGRFI